MKKNVEDLREHLFATLDALRDEKNPMDVARAKAIANVAAQIVNSAKLENEFAKLTGAPGSGFIPTAQIENKPGTPAAPRLVRGAATRG